MIRYLINDKQMQHKNGISADKKKRGWMNNHSLYRTKTTLSQNTRRKKNYLFLSLSLSIWSWFHFFFLVWVRRTNREKKNRCWKKNGNKMNNMQKKLDKSSAKKKNRVCKFFFLFIVKPIVKRSECCCCCCCYWIENEQHFSKNSNAHCVSIDRNKYNYYPEKGDLDTEKCI